MRPVEFFACVALTAVGCGGCEETICGQFPTDLSSDPVNCGACFHSCQPLEECVRGRCTCGPAPMAMCDGVCTNTGLDSRNCGGCGAECPADTPGCRGGKCGDCSDGPLWDVCDGACVYFESDHENCGGCGSACAATQACVSRQCVDGNSDLCVEPCDGRAGLVCCHGDDGDRCTNVLMDENNCQGCGQQCYTLCSWDRYTTAGCDPD